MNAANILARRQYRQLYGIDREEALRLGICASCRKQPEADHGLSIYQLREWRHTGLCPACLDAELEEIKHYRGWLTIDLLIVLAAILGVTYVFWKA